VVLPGTVLVVFVSNTVFVFTLLLVIGLVAFATLAYYLRTGLLVGMTLNMTAMVTILHGLYAVHYSSAALIFPLLLCIVSGVLLPASMLAYRGPLTTLTGPKVNVPTRETPVGSIKRESHNEHVEKQQRSNGQQSNLQSD